MKFDGSVADIIYKVTKNFRVRGEGGNNVLINM